MMKTIRATKYIVTVFILCLLSQWSVAQSPSNDNCSQAAEIQISNGGFGIGKFKSDTFNVRSAGLQTGETFHSSLVSVGNDQKSIWFKFYLPVKRGVSVELTQPASAIGAKDAGFTTYKSDSCLPTSSAITSAKLTPLNQFGSSFHPCLGPGWYLIQVGAKNRASGPVDIVLQVSYPYQNQFVLNATYDLADSAYDFGSQSKSGTIELGPKSWEKSYELGCYTLRDSTEFMSKIGPKYKEYSQSAWHTFKTDKSVDMVSVEVSGKRYPFSSNTIVGLRFYQGNARNGLTNLTLLEDSVVMNIDSFRYRYNAITDFMRYTRSCDLLPNTSYTVQLLFHKDLSDEVSVAIVNRTSPQRNSSPKPVLGSLPASNRLGVLSGTDTLTVGFSCDNRMSKNACGTTNPSSGILINGLTYNLSQWYSFELANTSKLKMRLPTLNKNYYRLLKARIYKATITNNCSGVDTSYLVGEYHFGQGSPLELNCLESGDYALQILGVDSLQELYGGTYHLGGTYYFETVVTKVIDVNHYSLRDTASLDSINSLNDLKSSGVSSSQTDTFGCSQTVLPADACAGYDRAMYRVFTLGDGDNDGTNDSGSLYISPLAGLLQTNNAKYFKWSLYNGNAGVLAKNQNVSQYPDTISGLNPIFSCQPQFLNAHSYHTCLTPGTYTLVTYGNAEAVGSSEKLALSYVKHEPKHISASNPEELGNVKPGDVVTSSQVKFTCTSNPDTIDGVTCGTKMIYRTFYLTADAVVKVQKYSASSGFNLTLFSGNIKNGKSGLKVVNINGDRWECFSTKVSTDCYPLTAGWYTVVSYAVGKTYADPAGLNSVGNYNSMGIDESSAVQISATQTQNYRSRYSRPYKAANVDSLIHNNNPLIWKPNWGSQKFPITTTKFEFPEEFLCDADTPATKHVVDFCDTNITNVTYYVFSLKKESFVKITDIPMDSRVKLYDLDIRKDSSQFKTAKPIQDCNYDNNFIEFCRMSPGTYTLVLQSVKSAKAIDVLQPYVWIDSVGYSRFDHAKDAYDFDFIDANNGWQYGKKGDTHPSNPNMSASQDWFFCTTGSSHSDPRNDCSGAVNPFVYPSKTKTAFYPNDSNYVVVNGQNHYYYNTVSRNIWYTFRAKGKGTVTTELRSLGRKLYSIYDNYENVLSYSVYESDEDGYLNWSQITGQGKVDSTFSQGLKLVAQTLPQRCSNFTNLQTSFKLDECDTSTAKRFYVVVNVRYPYQNKFPNLNYNVELRIKHDNIPLPPKVRFDQYSNASEIQGLVSGKEVSGDSTYFNGATTDLADSLNLACKTGKNQGSVWYKVYFDTTAYFNYRVKRYSRSGTKYLPSTHYTPNENIRLFKAVNPTDSLNGLAEVPGTTTQHGGNMKYYIRSCVSKGWYYILVDRCTNWGCFDYILPEVLIDYQYGDFCTDAIEIQLSKLGSASQKALINCHTIGTDYGEDGSNMGCLFGPSGFKSTWFKVSYSDTVKADLEFGLKEFTNAKAKDIRYRTYFGNCAALTPGPCNNNSLTSFTIDCIGEGTYYVHVVTPESTTGELELTATAYKNKDTTCVPINIFVPTSNFTFSSKCPENSVDFINLSSSGDSISYSWNFGYNKQTSTAKNPSFTYPASSKDESYRVLLRAVNNNRNTFDSLSKVILVPFTPSIEIEQEDTSMCSGDSIVLSVNAHGGRVVWNTGHTDTAITVSDSGWYKVSFNKGSNLVDNPGGEKNLSNGWKINSGLWSQRCGSPSPKVGSCYMSAGNAGGMSEIYQEVDLSGYTAEIDAGEAKSSLSVWFRTKVENPEDKGQVVLEYLDSTGVSLETYQSGMTSFSSNWLKIRHAQTVPQGARKVRIRLFAELVTGTSADVYFDDVVFTMTSECDYSDSVYVSIHALPEFALHNDTTLCNTDSLILEGPIGNGYSYTWHNNSSSSSFTAVGKGTYYLNVVDANKCVWNDTVHITTGITNYDLLYDHSPVCRTQDTVMIGMKLKGGWFTPTSFVDSFGVVSLPSTKIGQNLIKYTFRDTIGCFNPDSTYLTVYGLPDASITAKSPVCENGSAQVVQVVSNAGGTFFGGAYVTSGGTFSPSVATSGNHKIFYTFTDGNGCTSTDSTTIVVDTIPDATIAPTGSFCVSAGSQQLGGLYNSGGVFKGGNYISLSGAFSPSSAGVGTHPVYYTFTDTKGCTDSDTAMVTVDSLPDASITKPARVCASVDSITLLPAARTGGTFSGGNYISPQGSFYPVVSGAGSWKVYYTLTDGNNCSSLDSVIVEVDSIPNATIAASGPHCLNDGIQNIRAAVQSGGVFSGGTYISSGGAFDPLMSGSGLHPVFYQITDGRSCTGYDTLMVRVDTIPDARISPAGPFCKNQGTAQLSGLSNPGGTFSGTSITGSGVFDPMDAGTGIHAIYYQYIDGNGCTNNDSTTVQVDSIPDASLLPVKAHCFNSDSTQIFAEFNSGGTFSGGSFVSPSGWFNPAVSSVGQFNVYYQFTDGNGCTATDSVAITVNPLPDASITPAGPFCENGGLKQITPTVNTGGAFSGSGISSTGVFDPKFSGVGNHKVFYTFTDRNQCTNVDSLIVRVDSVPNAKVDLLPQVCVNAGLQQLQATVNSGGTYTGGTYVSSNGLFDPAVAGIGSHVVYYSFTDGNGCSNRDTITIKVDAYPDASIVAVPDLCVNSDIYTVKPANNFSGNFYGGAFVDSLGNFNPVVSGTGTFTVYYKIEDANGCLNLDSVLVTVHDIPDASIQPPNEICINAGSDTLQAAVNSGGTFYGGSYINSNGEFNPVQANVGSHYVFYTFTDGNGCTHVDSAVVIVNDIPDTRIVPAGPFCLNAGEQTILPETVSGGLFYSAASGVISPDGVFDPLAAGSGNQRIYYTFTDNNQCTNLDSTEIVVQSLPDASIQTVGELCENGLPVQLSAQTNTGGSFSGGSFIDATGVFNPIVAGQGQIKVYYTYKDVTGTGCENTDSLVISVHPKPNNPIVQSAESGCEPLEVNFSANQMDQLMWTITGENVLLNYSASDFSETFTQGEYNIELVSSSEFNCTDTVTSKLTVFALPIASFSYSPKQLFISNPKVWFKDESVGSVNSWVWTFGDFNGSNAQHPVHTYEESGSYLVNLEVVDSNNCLNITKQVVTIQEELLLYIPNAFSPNRDGINDVFGAAGVGYEKITYNIYNRWGEKLYQADNKGWNGMYKGQPVQHGVYMYFIEVLDTKGMYHSYSGSVKLLR